MHQSRCGIDSKRRAYDEENVSLLTLFRSARYVGHALAKEYYVGTQQRTVASLLAWSNGAARGRQLADVALVVDIARRTNFHQFAVKMDNLRRTRLLMQVVHILGNDGNIVILFQRSY